MADEVTSLLELARAKAAQRDERLAALAAELYGRPCGLLTDSDRSLMTGMVHGLVDSVAGALRSGLASRLVGHGRLRAALLEVPLDAVRARLCRSGVLAEPALIDCAGHRLLEFRLEQRARPGSGGSVTTVADASDMVAVLFTRADTATRRALTAFLIGQAKRLDGYGNPLLSFADVPESVLGLLFWAVAAVFHLALAPEAGNALAALDTAFAAANVEMIEAELAGGDPEGRPIAVAGRLIPAGLAGPELLAPLLAAGEVVLFEAVLSQLGGIALTRLRHFLFEPGGEALAVCARAVGLGRDDFSAILEATRAARLRPRPVEGDEVAAALALYDRIAPEAVERLVRYWARPRELLWMLRRLGAASDVETTRSA